MYSPHVSWISPAVDGIGEPHIAPVAPVVTKDEPRERYAHEEARRKRKASGQQRKGTVEDWMQTSVITVQPGQRLGELAELLSRHHISGAPVVDDEGHLVGVVSQSDLARLVARTQHEGTGADAMGFHSGLLDRSLFADPGLQEQLADRTVAEVLTPHAFWVEPNTPLRDAVDLMLEHHVHRVPVLEEGRLVGVLTTMDVLRSVRDRM